MTDTRPAKDSTTIAIIGGGASGTVTLHYLVQYYERFKPARPLRIYVFEKNKTPGLGVAYATHNDEHILNMRNGTIDIFPDKPGDFMGWLNTNAASLNLSKEDTDFDAFLPRRIVGLYLQTSLENSLQRARRAGIGVEFIHKEVTDFHETKEGQQLYFEDTYLDADYTVFALGNLPSTNYPALYDAPGYFHTPWQLNDEICSSAKPIGILGASLTAVDTLISLAPTTSGPLYFIAPNGRLPKILHIRKPFTPLFVTKENIQAMTNNFTRKLRLHEVFELFKREIETATGEPVDWSQIRHIDDDPIRALRTDIAKAERGENHWHTVLADTSPLLPLIWENLRQDDKETFYRTYYPWWRVYRVSMPLQNAKKVLRLLESGRLKVVRNVQAVEYDGGNTPFTITYHPPGRSKASLRVAYVVDATGTGFDVAKSKSKLIQNMINSGLLLPHSFGGVTVHPKTLRLIRQNGQEAHRTFFFGMLTKGVHFYTNALDVNAIHAEHVARSIIDDLADEISHPAIPLDAGRVDGWKEIAIHDDSLDPLIPLGLLSKEAATVMTSSVYFGEHSNSPYAKDAHKLAGSLLTLFARRSVARRLLAADKLLPPSYRLIVFDAYRSYEVQKSLYDFYRRQLKTHRPDMDDAALDLETQNYVSLPSRDPARPSPHNTGGAVDVAIIQSDGTMLDFGTPFDHGGEKAALAYYESMLAEGKPLTNKDRLACRNRRLLFSVMTRAGFQPYFAEWWHFNAPESQMGAATAGRKVATLGAVILNEDNQAHEKARLLLYQNSPRDPALERHWPTEIIAPPVE